MAKMLSLVTAVTIILSANLAVPVEAGAKSQLERILGRRLQDPPTCGGRCGPQQSSNCKSCQAANLQYCNSESGYCGWSDAHKNAQPSTEYDFCVDKEQALCNSNTFARTSSEVTTNCDKLQSDMSDVFGQSSDYVGTEKVWKLCRKKCLKCTAPNDEPKYKPGYTAGAGASESEGNGLADVYNYKCDNAVVQCSNHGNCNKQSPYACVCNDDHTTFYTADQLHQWKGVLAPSTPRCNYERDSTTTAVLFHLLLGWPGSSMFYTGNVWLGLVMACMPCAGLLFLAAAATRESVVYVGCYAAILCGAVVWSLVVLIMFCTGNITDGNDIALEGW